MESSRASFRAARSAALAALAAASLLAAADDEVPFVTTPDAVTLAMLELAAVTPRDHVVDLGSGDGRIVIAAARRFGATGLGVEIVPDLVRTSRERARAAGVQGRVEFREQDLFATDLAAATVVTMYLLPEVNLQLRPRLLALAPGTRIVSHDWDMGDWRPDRTITVDVPDKALGRDKFSRVHGRWCAADASIEVVQRFQRFSATLTTAGSAAPAWVFDGRIEAATLRGEGVHPISLRLEGETLQLLEAPATGPARTFARALSGACP